MDGISMKGNIKDINSNTSHVLVTEYTFFSGPLEGSFHGVLDFRKELNTLSGINETVRSVSVGSKAPNLLRICFIPFELIDEDSGSFLSILPWSNLLIFDHIG